MCQFGLVLAQHMSLAYSSQWYQLISEGLLTFFNYYALFKIIRDYWMFLKLNEKEGKEN